MFLPHSCMLLHAAPAVVTWVQLQALSGNESEVLYLGICAH